MKMARPYGRDFRLLIAIDVVRGFPDRVACRPERYAMPAGKSMAEVKAELQNVLASEFAARKFSYTRSDGCRGRCERRHQHWVGGSHRHCRRNRNGKQHW
jgi:hypothetical protein